LNVKPGEYLLSINGRELEAKDDVSRPLVRAFDEGRRNRVQVGQEGVLLRERQVMELRAGEEGPPHVDIIDMARLASADLAKFQDCGGVPRPAPVAGMDLDIDLPFWYYEQQTPAFAIISDAERHPLPAPHDFTGAARLGTSLLCRARRAREGVPSCKP